MKAIKLKYGLVFLIFFASFLFSQDGNTGNWLSQDRMLPYDSIPFQQVIEALDYQEEMREYEGFSMSPQVGTWINIGPSNDYRNGRVVRVKYDPGDNTGNTVYICGHNGGVWRSDNAQANPSNNVVFSFKTMGLQIQAAGDVAIDPQDHNTIYFGTGGNVYCSEATNFYGIGVYKSTNKGDNWTGPYKSGLPTPIFTSTIVVNPYNRHIYLADGRKSGPYGYSGEAGLYRSTNGGSSWEKVAPTSGFEECYDVVVSNNGQYVYAVTKTGYWRSTNYGNSFFKPDPDGPYPTLNGRTQIAISKANNNYIYIVTDKISTNTNYAYVSTDGGVSFSDPPYNLGTDHGCMTLDFFYVQASPYNHLVAYVGFGGAGSLFRTTNGGQTYHNVSGGGFDFNNFAFNPFNQNQAMECNDQGLYISNNILAESSVSWTSLNYSLSVRGNYRVASNPYNASDMVIAVTDAGYFKYRGSVTWEETHSCCDGTAMVHTKSPAVDAFIGGKGAYNNGLHSSTNGGENWTYYTFSWGYLDGNLDWMYPITEKPGSSNYGTFFSPRRNANPHSQIDINVSYNYGQTWTNNSTNTGINPINSGYSEFSPQWMSVCDANTNLMYVSTKRWLVNPSPLSQVWRTTNGGQTWLDLEITNHGVPNRVITTVVADPVNQNIVYVTLSGFGTGHVFKSTNKGDSWYDISGGYPQGDHFWVPNTPVNYLIIRYISATQKQLYIGTDMGVYVGYDPPLPEYVDGYHWNEIASGLPNTICLGLDYNLASNKLRAALHGRGVWEVQLTGAVYITGNEVMASTGNGLDVANDIVVTSGSTLTFPQSSTIKMPAGKKIIVENGGKIEVTSNDPVYFTSQSGSWGGIEIQGSGCGTIKKAVFDNTETPITIDGQGEIPVPILITDCVFNNGSVIINGRDSITVQKCTTNTASSSTGIAICVNYSAALVLSQNTINDCWAAGISVSNSSPVILNNIINHAEESNTAAGISLDNCYSGTVNYNKIYHYCNGIYLYYSSPTMLENEVVNNTTSMTSDPAALSANYLSSPRLNPIISEEGTIWDAGINSLKTNNQGNGIYLYEFSIPNIDYGYNSIYGYDYHLSGWIGEGGGYEYYARNNCWAPDEPPVRENITDASVIDDPYTCDPPEGASQSGGGPGADAEKAMLSEAEAPPPPIIINYGNGIFDTIKVTNGHFPLTADQLLFSQGLNEEIAGNYQQAINKYKLVVQNYQDSGTAISSMKKILHCSDKLQVDTNAYTLLRTYYLNLAGQNANDTGFVKAANEMASKCLVRTGEYPGAITEYEDVVQSSNDSLEVLCAELNIIETYMIMEREGDLPGFTGQIRQLKPESILDGIRMINEKLHKLKLHKKEVQIPKVFRLSQNYPNPFNPLTKIDYALPKKTNVTIEVYDILGRLVKTLVNEVREAGNYTVTFNGTDYSSGVYFYTIEAGEFKLSKKMVLVK